MLIDFFLKLKQGGVPSSIREFLVLNEALQKEVAFGRVEDFYYLARTCLVKDEKYFDRYDRVFSAYFKGIIEVDPLAVEIPEEWLKKLAEKLLTEEEKKLIESLGGWDKLMETLKKRLEEQKGRHQGGNKWIGTGGTSPFREHCGVVTHDLGTAGMNQHARESVQVGQNRRGARIRGRMPVQVVVDLVQERCGTKGWIRPGIGKQRAGHHPHVGPGRVQEHRLRHAQSPVAPGEQRDEYGIGTGRVPPDHQLPPFTDLREGRFNQRGYVIDRRRKGIGRRQPVVHQRGGKARGICQCKNVLAMRCHGAEAIAPARYIQKCRPRVRRRRPQPFQNWSLRRRRLEGAPDRPRLRRIVITIGKGFAEALRIRVPDACLRARHRC